MSGDISPALTTPPMTIRESLRLLKGVPHPIASSNGASATMRANRRSNTQPEVRIRSLLHRAGFRFRKDHAIKLGSEKVRPDVVFSKKQLAVFIDGCFWHNCPEHGRIPRLNAEYWRLKLAYNSDRDRQSNLALENAGWLVLRIWEHVQPNDAVNQIAKCLDSKSNNRTISK